MVDFGVIKGSEGEFSTILENKLQVFQEGFDKDYYAYHENSGRSRKKHYVICSERLANSLQEVDWKNLKGFRQIEMGEDSGSGDVDDERAKFVVEKLVDEWIDYYELTKPGSYIKRFFKNSKNPTTNELSDEFKREKEGKDLSSGIYRSAWKFDEDGFVGKEESYESTCLSQPSSVKNSTSNSRGFESKCCSSCNRDFFTNAKFCEDCGKELENKISEIVPDETSGNNHPRRGGSKVIGNPLIWGSGVIISLIGLFFVR